MQQRFSETRGRALVMDPDPARLGRRCGQLSSDGWQVVRVTDLADALAQAKSGKIDVAMLRLPTDEAEAMDLPGVLRLAAGLADLPVVILAPDPGEHTRCQMLDSGADEVIGDSVSRAELLARLRALLRMKVLRDELVSSREALTASLSRERALLAQLRRDNARLLTLCTTDPLTHLQNIRHFDTFLESSFRIARRYGRPISVLVFDLDHFKVVNDTHGHPSGDYVLKEFAVILKRCVRDSDIVARTGGEEFSIILPDARRSQTRKFAMRIRQAVGKRKFNVYGSDIHITSSVGSASYPEDVQITEAHMLVYFADQALLQAKQLGRDRLVSFHELGPAVRRQLSRQYLLSGQTHRHSRADAALVADARR